MTVPAGVKARGDILSCQYYQVISNAYGDMRRAAPQIYFNPRSPG